MSETTRGKFLREDYGPFFGRGHDWPSYPRDLHPLYPYGASTSVVCANCGRPAGGLRYDATSEQFVHRTKVDCGPANQSMR
jgi:hypothetical protein